MLELGELGYEGFEETTGGLDAYIATDRFRVADLERSLTLRDPHVHVSWSASILPNRNWNAEWEASFQPVEVGREVRIRAEHHPAVPGFAHDLVITPRMAFGTGHHATTHMMVRAMLGQVPLDPGAVFKGLRDLAVCDLGCGTAVLAILAERLGASSVRAIDIDEQAVINARENVERNGCSIVTVEKGTAADLVGHTYDVILANIERNTLLNAMTVMVRALRPGGLLFLSGFVRADGERMSAAAAEHGLVPYAHAAEGEWALLVRQRSHHA